MDKFNGQAEQDKFVLNVLKGKRNGYFLEIGSNHPIKINNTYLLENVYKWKGILIEFDQKFLPMYKEHRPDSVHIIEDATKIDYLKLFEDNNVPKNIDYLSLDIEPSNGSTLNTLINLDQIVMDKYKFSVITFEHDFFRKDWFETRKKSREIFDKRGYFRIFQDVNNNRDDPYEDWYVHPSLVDMDYINKLKLNNVKNYKQFVQTSRRRLDEPIMSINWRDIKY